MMRLGLVFLLLMNVLTGSGWWAPTPPRPVLFPPARREVLV